MNNFFGQRQAEAANPAAGGVADWIAFNIGPTPLFLGNPGPYPNAQDFFTGNYPFATQPRDLRGNEDACGKLDT